MADPLKTAKKIFDQFLSKADPAAVANYDPKAKEPQAQAAGQRGGLKGGKARARKLSASRRKHIAKVAAAIRWRGERR
jgi:hypothetical protein